MLSKTKVLLVDDAQVCLNSLQQQLTTNPVFKCRPSEIAALRLIATKRNQRIGQQGLLNRLAVPMLRESKSRLEKLPNIQRVRTQHSSKPDCHEHRKQDIGSAALKDLFLTIFLELVI